MENKKINNSKVSNSNKGKIKFYHIPMEEYDEIDMEDVKEIDPGDGCTIIVTNDDFLIEANQIEFA